MQIFTAITLNIGLREKKINHLISNKPNLSLNEVLLA